MPYYRRNLVILSFVIFLAACSWNQVVPFLPLFLEELGAKQNLVQWIGFVFAAQSIASIIAMPFWGKLGDSYGRKPMVIRAGICLAGIYFGMSFSQTPWQLAVFRFLNGALTGFIPGAFTLIATNTPQEKAARAVATAHAASAVGLIVGPALGQWLSQFVGYRSSMQVSGAAVFFCVLLVVLLVKEPNKVKPVEKTSLLEDFRISLRSPVMISVMFTVMIQAVFGAAISPYLALHMKTMDAGLTGLVFSLPAVAFVLTARYWTRVGERLGFNRAILIGLMGGAVCTLFLALVHNVWLFAAVYFAAGVFIAAISPSTAALICVKVDEGFRGRAYGMQSAASTLGALIAPLAAAQIAAFSGIESIFLFVGVVFFLGSVVFRSQARSWCKSSKGSVK